MSTDGFGVFARLWVIRFQFFIHSREFSLCVTTLIVYQHTRIYYTIDRYAKVSQISQSMTDKPKYDG